MSLGQHAVIVDPQRYSGTRQELAERLAPVLRVPAGQVISMLARGRVTVDADLDERTAKRLARRLTGLGLPAQIVDEDGGLAFEAPPSSAPERTAPAPERKKSAGEFDDLLAAFDDIEMVDFDDQVDLPEIETVTDEQPVGEEDADELDAWGAVLPGIGARDDDSGEVRAPESETAASPVDERSSSLLAQFEESAKRSEERKRPASPPPPQPASPGPPGSRQQTASASPAVPTGLPATATAEPPTEAPPARDARTPRPAADSKPEPAPKASNVSPEERREIEASRSFNASALTAALSPRSEDDRPPFAPTGFDPDPPHMAGAATAFSVIAPGAGQVFNGDDEEALGYGLKFFLVKPWIDSVRDARRRGEKISEYWLPRPEPGATFRAIRYVVLWWLAVSAVVFMLVALGRWGWDYMNREPVVELTEAEIATATEDAVTNVRLARIEALRALSEAQLSMPSERFTMSDEERADRLFIIGYNHCEERNYSTCETIMKRVASLNKGDPRAFRLQAWASAARSGNAGPFPALEGIPTLTDFETEELSVELGVPSPNRIRDEKQTKRSKYRDGTNESVEVDEVDEATQPDAGITDTGTSP